MLKRNHFTFAGIVLAFWLTLMSASSLAQLSGQEMYYRGTPINPVIQSMLESVSTDSILSYLETVVSFYTRQTNSDTTSSTIGIGAARNFIFNKFKQFSNQTGGGVTPSFFIFPATVCGKFNSAHKNVLATVTGTQTPDRIFIASGHMDGRTINVCDDTSFAPSANDDGSGTVASIEMARIISQFADNMESTLILMTVTGEDQGLFGSTAYANWSLNNNLRIDGMITNDVVGNITGCDDPSCSNGNFITDSISVRHFSGGPSTASSRQLSRYMKLKAEQYVTEVPWTVNLIPFLDRPGRSGDHVPFYNNGYAAARFTEAHEYGDGTGSNGHQHNETDLIEFMNIPYLARIIKTNIAGLASLAMAPETPTAPIDVQNVGNGTDLLLTWAATNTEPDFAGYRIAWRHPDSLFYQQIFLAGNVTQFTVTGLTPEQPVYLSYSALDTSGNESIFSQEILATPSTTPAAPQGFDATSTKTGIQFAWLPNTEMDLTGYKITRTAPGTTDKEFDIDASQTTFFDNTALPHILYHYTIQARDSENNLSPASIEQRGQLTTHDLGILILDASKDSPGNYPLFPSDEQVDDFYDDLLVHFNIGGQWDIADSMEQNLAISDADMGIYSSIVLHSDVRLTDNPIAEDTVALRKYLQNGGHLFMSGWKLIKSASNNSGQIKIFSPGDFVYEFMQIDTSKNATTADFSGADPVAAGYPFINVDSAKTPNLVGILNSMEVFQSMVGGTDTEVLYKYRSSQQPPSEFHGMPVALRHITADLGIIVTDFPLYFMEEAEAQQVITNGLMEFGEVTGIENDRNNPAAQPNKYSLNQNYPNPFNPSTRIRFSIPVQSKVVLRLYNTIGEELRVLVNEEKEAGAYEVEFNANNLPSGVYFYRLRAGNFVKTKKMILLR